jgi:hypothetical protein
MNKISHFGQLTVAYVPSPSFSSCWKELGFLLSIFLVLLYALEAKGMRAFVRIGRGERSRCGGRLEVYCGSHRREDGATVAFNTEEGECGGEGAETLREEKTDLSVVRCACIESSTGTLVGRW